MPQAVVVKKENDAGFVELARLGRAHEGVLHLIDEIIHPRHHENNGQGEVGKTSQVDGFLRSVLKIWTLVVQSISKAFGKTFPFVQQFDLRYACGFKHSRS